MNKDFLRQVFTDEKRLFKKNQVSYVHVPHFDELSVKKLWLDLKDDDAFNIYFQDKFADAKGPSREYFFNILNTVYPQYLKQIMEHASKQRFSAEGEEVKQQAIKATDAWYAELQKMPFVSCKLFYS